MTYRIEVLDSDIRKTAELRGATAARLRERVNVPGTLTVETVEPDDWEGIAPGTTFLRVRSTEGYGTFRVREVRAGRVRERRSLTVTARHIIGDTADEVFAGAVSCIGYTPADLLGRVLAFSRYEPGTIEPAAAVPFVRFEYEPVWDCLLRICSLTGGELLLDEAAGTISLAAAIGSDSGAGFRYGYNLVGASRTVDAARLVNRVYGAGGGEPLLTLADAAASGGLPYIEDAASIAAHGLVEGVFHDPSLEAVVNLVAAPALDGVYTDGLCEYWTADGAPALSRNTDPDRCLYGLVSQRVESAADGQGISQEVAVSPGTVYSLLAHLFLADGTVRVQVADGTSVYRRAAPVAGTGLAVVRIENWKANTAAVTVSIRQDGAGSADFCVDSVQVAAGARVRPFTVGSSADTLWERSAAFLDARSDPVVRYDVRLADAAADRALIGAAAVPADRFGLGDTVRVEDEGLGITVTTRVMERDLDLLRPWRLGVRLDTPSRTLADVLAALREAQEAGIRHARAIMTAASDAAEAGSARLGFGNFSFRFFGTVTATAWNAFSWSAGTLRVGDAWYAIGAGSASGLPASATRYCYFDRTVPTTFGITATAAEAEGEDRILLFAVTTTTSPTLCEIHPMGIIKG